LPDQPEGGGGLFSARLHCLKNGEDEASRALLKTAHQARGEDWKPEGAVAEGDVAKRMHTDDTSLSRFWEHWEGAPDPDTAFGPLDGFLEDW